MAPTCCCAPTGQAAPQRPSPQKGTPPRQDRSGVGLPEAGRGSAAAAAAAHHSLLCSRHPLHRHALRGGGHCGGGRGRPNGSPRGGNCCPLLPPRPGHPPGGWAESRRAMAGERSAPSRGACRRYSHAVMHAIRLASPAGGPWVGGRGPLGRRAPPALPRRGNSCRLVGAGAGSVGG